MSFNKVIIVGNLGKDPELKYTPQGKAVCDFSVATTDKRKDSSGEVKEETTWFRVTFWERQAEVASQYLAKGRQVYVEGRLRTREWTDKDGRVRTSLEVTGTELKLIGSRGEENGSAAGAHEIKGTNSGRNPSMDTPLTEITEDDIPF